MGNVEGGETYLRTGRLHLWETRQDFSMVGLREPITLTDHQMVLGVLHGEGVTRHRLYVKGQTTWPIQEEKGKTSQIEGASQSRDLKRKANKPSSKNRRTSALWITDTTWNLAYQRTKLVRKSRANQGEHTVLTRRFQLDLWEDSRSRVRRVGEDIEA